MPCRPIRQPRTIAPPASAVAPTKGEESMPLPLHTSTQPRPPHTSSSCPIARRAIMYLCLCIPLTQTPPPAITLQDSLTAVHLPLLTRALPMPSKGSGLPLMPSTIRLRATCPATRTLARCSMPTTTVRQIRPSTIRPGRLFSMMAIRTSMLHPSRQPAKLNR
jgi:hypothetical protein